MVVVVFSLFFFFQAEDGIRDRNVTGVQTCALPILRIEEIDQRDIRVRFEVDLQVAHEPAGGQPEIVADQDDRLNVLAVAMRSEERRVGKECRTRCWTDDYERKGTRADVIVQAGRKE